MLLTVQIKCLFNFFLQISDAQDLIKSKGGWSAREELLLLNGIEGFGFGNWKDIALKLENRTAEGILFLFLHFKNNENS